MNPNEPSSEPIATGDRRDEARVLPDRDQKFRAEFLCRPESPTPPEMESPSAERGELPPDSPPVEDVRVAPETPSVWDARPPGGPMSSEPSGESGH